MANRRTRRFECLASECEEDVHCFPGELCRAVTTGATGQAPIRRCTPEGLRREGESCDSLPISPGGSCREGLRCVQGVCGVACRMEEPTSCPAGHACEESPDGPAFVPDEVCGEGWWCTTISEDMRLWGCSPLLD